MKKLLFASKTTTFSLILLIGTILGSCKKENQIEKNLWKNGGDWDVKIYSSQYGSTNPSLYSYSTNFLVDCGKFHFAKDGTGTGNIVENGVNTPFTFNYSNTETKLTLIFDNGSSYIYSIDWTKDDLKITRDNSTTDPDGYKEYDYEKIYMEYWKKLIFAEFNKL